MVKPESQARFSNARSHPSERRLISDTEAQANSNVTVQDSVVDEYKPTQKQPTPEDIENDFLKCYSNFLGSDLNEKTTWKSENFSQSHANLKPDRPEDSRFSKIANPQSGEDFEF
jgi:hypothetical protein